MANVIGIDLGGTSIEGGKIESGNIVSYAKTDTKASIGIGVPSVVDNDANCGSGEFGEIPYMNGKLEDLCGSRFFTEVAGKSGYELSLEARSENEEGKKMFDEYGWNLAYLVKIVVLTLDPQAIIFGGSIAKSFDLFKDAIFANLADFPYPKSIEKLTLLSSNKENSGIKQQPHNQDNEISENNPNPRTGLETDNAGPVLKKGALQGLEA